MKYERVAAYVSNTLWAIHPSKLAQIVSVLAFRASGQEFTAEEIQARIGAGDGRTSPAQRGAVAIIPIRGTIANRMSGLDASSGGASVEEIGAMIDRAASDPNVSAIVYDIDSPGGTVPGVSELAAKMYALRGTKKQVAQVNDLAASAAYWLASQCDEIVSIPSGTAGSIGVFTAHQDMSKALKQEGIDITVISAGKFKVEGNPFEPLSDEAKAVIQARVDEAYAQFVKDVARGRGVSPAAVRSGYGEGRALTAKDAKAAGLIDRIDTMDATLVRMTGRASSVMRAEQPGDAVMADGSDLEPLEPVPPPVVIEPDVRLRRLL